MNYAYKKFSLYLMSSLLLTMLGACLGTYQEINLNPSFIKGTLVLSLVLVIAFLFSKGKLKKILFFIFSFGEGLTLSIILLYTSAVNLMACMILVVLITAVFLIIGIKVKSLRFMGGFLFASLLGLLVYQVIAMFIPLPSLALLGVFLFSLYIAFDINMFKIHVQSGVISDDDIINHAMSIYLDILNLLLNLLKIISDITK